MWVFLTRRLRTWLVLAVALPLARTVVHSVATAAHERRPDTTSARVLGRADAGLTEVTRRARRRRRR